MEKNDEEMIEREKTINKNTANLFEKTLNSHGYSFHYSVLKRFEQLSNANESSWLLEGTEFPVELNNKVSHVDFIQRSKSENFFLIAECKRVDPARGFWCFAKAPYTWYGSKFYNKESSLVQFDQLRRFSDIPQFNSSTRAARTKRESYNLGFEIETGKKGDGTGTGKNNAAINSAIFQALTGVSGFINHLSNLNKDYFLIKKDRDYKFIPVIFTTARILVTDADLSMADLNNGYLEKETVKTKEVPWIWFNHNRQASLSHDVRFHYDNEAKYSENEATASRYFQQFTRSVAIVSTLGIDEFIRTRFEDWLK